MATAARRLTPAERRSLEDEGWVLRTGVLAPDEISKLRAAVEDVAARVKARALRPGAGPKARLADGHRLQFSSRASIQWEWREGSEEIRLIEPVDHLHHGLAALFADPRLVEPMRDVLDRDEIAPFTSKLNLKRAGEGSEFPFHQDYPYWYAAIEEDAGDAGTAIVFLDDTEAANGALRVLSGSHRHGPAPRDRDDPTRFLADPARLGRYEEVTVEAAAGSVLLFGAYLVHRSSPNTTAADRRALLMSFQPAGRARFHEMPFRAELVERLP